MLFSLRGHRTCPNEKVDTYQARKLKHQKKIKPKDFIIISSTDPVLTSSLLATIPGFLLREYLNLILQELTQSQGQVGNLGDNSRKYHKGIKKKKGRGQKVHRVSFKSFFKQLEL